MNFDSIEPEHPDKLSHPTANRAKLPAKRRPLSTVLVGNGEENGLDVDVKKETSPPIEEEPQGEENGLDVDMKKETSPSIEEEPQEKPVIKETEVGKRAVNLRLAPHPIIPHTTAPTSYSSSNSVSSIASKRASFLASSSTATATAVFTTISSLTKTSVLSKISGASPSITSDSKVGSHVVLKSETVQLPPGAAAVHTEMNFDSIEPHPDKLSHLTANRARLPAKRRPPSTIFVGNGEENGLDVDVKKETSPPIEEEPQEKPVIKETGVGKRAVNLRPAPHPIIPHTTAPSSYSSSNSVSSIASKRASFLSSSSTSTPTPTATAVVTTISSLTKTSSVLSKTSGASPSITSDSKVSSHVVLKSETVQLPPGAAAVHTGKTQVDQSALENLKKELHELRSNSVSKATYNELKSEVEKLRKDLEFIKTSYSRKFTHEIDEEKKIRLNTQVELDRL